MISTGQRVQLAIGGVCMEIEGVYGCDDSLIRQPYDAFVSASAGAPDLRIRVCTDSYPQRKQGGVLLHMEDSWSIYDAGEHYFCEVNLQPERDLRYQRALIMDKRGSYAEIYCSSDALSEFGVINWIFDVPLGQFMINSCLSAADGLLLHCCAVKHRDQGYIFVGESGSGKSTLAGLWRSALPEATVLSDERVILRRLDSGWWIFGTPWTGSGSAVSPRGVKLSRLYFIEHAPENTIQPIGKEQALPAFLSNMRLPLWDKRRTEQVLQMVDEFLSTVPGVRLGFLPTNDVIATLRT